LILWRISKYTAIVYCCFCELLLFGILKKNVEARLPLTECN